MSKPIRFPIDCPTDCKYHKSWDLSIDDWTHVCTKLNKQMDEYDYGFGLLFGQFLFCPLSDEEIEDLNNEK